MRPAFNTKIWQFPPDPWKKINELGMDYPQCAHKLLNSIKIRQSHHCLIFIMEIPIPGKTVIILKWGPGYQQGWHWARCGGCTDDTYLRKRTTVLPVTIWFLPFFLASSINDRHWHRLQHNRFKSPMPNTIITDDYSTGNNRGGV